jgi:hypothetical protein
LFFFNFLIFFFVVAKMKRTIRCAKTVGLPLALLAPRPLVTGRTLRRAATATTARTASGADFADERTGTEAAKLWAALAAQGPAFPLRSTSAGGEGVQILPTPDDFFNQLKVRFIFIFTFIYNINFIKTYNKHNNASTSTRRKA